MSKPTRIRRSRQRGYKMPAGTVYVGRPTKWGNPWTPKNHTVVTMAHGTVTKSRPGTVAECVEAYIADVDRGTFGYGRDEIRAELAGKNLACWCRLGEPCHADFLLKVANP